MAKEVWRLLAEMIVAAAVGACVAAIGMGIVAGVCV